MKRIYMKPNMKVVEHKTRNHLLVGSDVRVYSEEYDDETMDDL